MVGFPHFGRIVHGMSAVFLVVALAGTNRCQEDYEFATRTNVNRTVTPTETPDPDDDGVVTRTPTQSSGTVNPTATEEGEPTEPQVSPSPTQALFSLLQELGSASAAAGSEHERRIPTAVPNPGAPPQFGGGEQAGEGSSEQGIVAIIAVKAEGAERQVAQSLQSLGVETVSILGQRGFQPNLLLKRPLLAVLDRAHLSEDECAAFGQQAAGRIPQHFGSAPSGQPVYVVEFSQRSIPEASILCKDIDSDAVIESGSDGETIHAVLAQALQSLSGDAPIRGGHIVVDN